MIFVWIRVKICNAAQGELPALHILHASSLMHKSLGLGCFCISLPNALSVPVTIILLLDRELLFCKQVKFLKMFCIYEIWDSAWMRAQVRHLAILATGPQYCSHTAGINSASTWGTVICQHLIWTNVHWYRTKVNT